MRDELRLDYDDLAPELAAEQRLGRPAGVYLLAGRFHVANRATRAEARLLERGALLVADLVFDAVQAERASSGGAPAPRVPPADLRPLLNREAVDAIKPSPSDN
jgi:hypothetical protein